MSTVSEFTECTCGILLSTPKLNEFADCACGQSIYHRLGYMDAPYVDYVHE